MLKIGRVLLQRLYFSSWPLEQVKSNNLNFFQVVLMESKLKVGLQQDKSTSNAPKSIVELVNVQENIL
jgi:hypothetical protein